MEGLFLFVWIAVINIISCQQAGYRQQYYNKNAAVQPTTNQNRAVIYPSDNPEEEMKSIFPNQQKNPSAATQYALNQQSAISPAQYYSPKITTFSNREDEISIFAWKLLKNTKPALRLQNLALSPVLVQFLLTILEQAASGETLNQIRQITRGINSNDIRKLFDVGRSATQLKLASGIFADHSAGVNESFAEYVRNFDVTINPVDFNNANTAKYTINNWVSRNTGETIPKLLGDSYQTQGIQTILISAAYFQSTWLYAFDNAAQGPFYNEEGTIPNVQYIQTRNSFYTETYKFGEISVNAIEIPYEGQTHSMLILVPEKISLQQFLDYIDPQKINWVIKTISQAQPQMLTLRIPKFTIQTRSSLVNALLKMGLVDLFTIRAKLPYLINTTPVINDILQEVVLKVDEKGTIASAATGAVLIPLSAASVNQEKKFFVDRSFIVLIIDKRYNSPLFISKVHTP